ncbi:MAG: phosphate/phosphite/phosphonate ABC transporter substrate-binding protein [Chromatiales bacterium]|nr:phosphate/phosphite/phosphonate ABC transporter substrate-binding protein [Chromatiales bacterium]
MKPLPYWLVPLLLVALRPATAGPVTLSFGIVPQQSASELAKAWVPILSYLSAKTGYRLSFKTAPNIPEFERRCGTGEYDIAYMNPYHYTVFHRDPGYQVFARQKDKLIQGIVVTRRDSPYHELSDLQGQTLAFPSPAAFAASVLPRAELKRRGIAFEPKYVSSHDSVYRSVAKGLMPAGGGIKRTFNNVSHDIRDQLRVLWTTKGYTPHAFAALPGVDPQAVTTLQAAMVAMDQDAEGRAALKTIGFTGIEAGQDSDWNDVRELGIDLLEALIKG